jgi:hypothetical protein
MDAVVPKSEKQSRKGDKLTRQQVGSKLKQLYADVVAEPVPDRFLELLDKLGGDGAEPGARPAHETEKRKDSL